MADTISGNSSTGPSLGHESLRSEQISAISRWTVPLAACSVLSGSTVAIEFWENASHLYLVMLVGMLVVVHATATAKSLAWLRNPAPSASRRMLRLRIAASAIIALVWGSVPFMLMPMASLDQRQLLIYIGTGLMSSSILLAPILAASLSFLGITTVSLLLPMPFIGQTISVHHTVLVLVFMLATLGVVMSQARDFAARVMSELKLKDQSETISILLNEFEENASDFLWEINADLKFVNVSERLIQVLETEAALLEASSLFGWVSGSHSVDPECCERNAQLLRSLSEMKPFRDLRVSVGTSAQSYWLSLTGKPVHDAAGRFCGFRGVGSDLTTLHKSDERVQFLARHDSLTTLPNRVRFQEVLQSACDGSEMFAVHCLDLDGFKTINDTLGHSGGDALLVAVARRLRACLREGDLVARLGGDEFAVLQIYHEAAEPVILAQRLINHVGEPYQIGNSTATVGVSIGISLAGTERREADDLLRGADLALYQSKSAGRGMWSVFDVEMALRAEERYALQADLRNAIANDELFIEYQPIFDFATDSICGAEALVRWQHQTRGRIPPISFIPAAEESGLITALGAWVLRRACADAKSWESEIRVAVNLSSTQFRDPGLLALIDATLLETGLSPDRLELEITESVFLEKVEDTLNCLNALRARGIHIALDDFGTGYSSLSYLRSFPFDKVKIDQSFIRDLSLNDDAITIVQAIVGMAGGLGIRTTGEGVETDAQATLLEKTGCTQVQGYRYGRPCSHQMFKNLLGEVRPTRHESEIKDARMTHFDAASAETIHPTPL